jgi:hypothetical protein
MRKTVTYYTNKDISYEVFRDLKAYYMKDCHVDFFICSENPLTNIIVDTACINAYYLSWLKGDIVFTNLDDLNKKKNEIIGKPILYLKHDYSVDLSNIDCQILIRDKKGTINEKL